jgi:hypothetical protein
VATIVHIHTKSSSLKNYILKIGHPRLKQCYDSKNNNPNPNPNPNRPSAMMMLPLHDWNYD